jgi:tripartite ATP-independent transporter DctM subunit
MIELSPEILTILLLGGVVVGALTGYPIGLVLGGLALLLGYGIWGHLVFDVIFARVYDGILVNYVLVAVPLFIIMGSMIGHSGLAEKMFDALYLWLGGVRGGLAVGVLTMGTVLAACIGTISAEVTMLTIVTLRPMINRGYSKSLATGTICAGGCLGILIPPSVMLVIYGPMAVISVGKLFMGAFGPGLLLSASYISYILLRCLIQPKIAPAVPVEERRVSFIKKTYMLIVAMAPTVLLIMGVLGVIFLGIAPPTEAAAAGAFIATILVIAYGKFSWGIVKEVTLFTVKTVGFIMLIAAMAAAFTSVFMGGGCGDVLKETILAVPGGRWGAFGSIMFIIFILGFFVNWIAIIFIVIPIITPIGAALGFDSLWFAIMVCVNLQMGFMTPPFAFAIFYVRGAASPDLGVTMADIIRGVIPFVLIIMFVLVLCVIFPEIILWLPGQMIR